MNDEIRSVVCENLPGEQQIISEGSVYYKTEKIDINDDGIFQYIKGAHYPMKGWPDAGAIFAVNLAKKVFVKSLKLGSKKEFWPTIFLFLIKTNKGKVKMIEEMIEAYNEIVLKVISPYILRPVFMTPMAREIGRLSTNFLMNLGITERQSLNASKILAMMFELDNAYRYRVQDMFSESSAYIMTRHPAKEIVRLLDLLTKRDSPGVSEKFNYIKPFVRISFMSKKVKNAFVDALKAVDFTKLQFDEIDRYWVAMRNDYDYWGQGVEERSKYLADNNLTIPVPVQPHKVEEARALMKKNKEEEKDAE